MDFADEGNSPALRSRCGFDDRPGGYIEKRCKYINKYQ